MIQHFSLIVTRDSESPEKMDTDFKHEGIKTTEIVGILEVVKMNLIAEIMQDSDEHDERLDGA